MFPCRQHRPSLSRRQFLSQAGCGFGAVALAALLAEESRAAGPTAGPSAAPPTANESWSPRPAHFAAKAKSVIFLYMDGGVSQVDSFDPKPKLTELNGKPFPVKMEPTQFNNNGSIMPSPWEFKRYGQSGLEVSDLFPHVGSCADDLAVIRSMTAQFSEHAQGNFFMHTGLPFIGYPSAGAWINYGLGSESQNLPGFVVLKSGGSVVPHGGVSLYSNGFLPAENQASFVDADAADAVRNIRPKESLPLQRRRIDFIRELDRGFLEQIGGDDHVEGAIRNYETAFRMQTAVPDLVDISQESQATLDMYGPEVKQPGSYAYNCLLARRLAERGVRFTQVFLRGWDHHGGLPGSLPQLCKAMDQPTAALLKDLKQRGMLEDTLVVWGGEFGRTVYSQGTLTKDNYGRDHHPRNFCMWMAGGGVKPGIVHGATDDFSYNVTEKPVHIHDLNATILHCLGLDHEKLTYRFQGRDFRLTDVHGNVVKEILL